MHVPPQDAIVNTSANANHAELHRVREVTLKAFSPSDEIQYPGFQLLSLSTPPSPSSHLPSVSTVACFFPDYPSVYPWRYLPLFFLTTLTLVFLRQRKLRSPALPTHHRRSTLVQSFSLNSLPSGSWNAQPHPPTPFSPDWSPRTAGFYAPARPRIPGSPTEDLPKDSLRAPAASATSPAASEPVSPCAASTARSSGPRRPRRGG